MNCCLHFDTCFIHTFLLFKDNPKEELNIPWTSHSGGQCPSCHKKYHNRWKPEKCKVVVTSLGDHISPTHTRGSNCVQVLPGIYSLLTNTSGSRCFANVNDHTLICYHEKCLKQTQKLLAALDGP